MALVLSWRGVGWLMVGWLAAWPAGLLAEVARPADAVVDSFGINTHAGLPWMIYDNDANWAKVIAAVGDLGIRYVRDDPIRVDRLNALSAQTGAKVVLIAQDGWTRIGAIDQSGYASVLSRMKNLTHLAYIEGPNEPDGVGDPDWASKLMWWQQHLYTDAKADPALASKPVVGPSAIQWPSVPGIAQYMDYSNIHPYPGGYQPAYRLAPAINSIQTYLGPKPVFVSEVGYSTVLNDVPNDISYGVTEAAHGKYMPRLVLDFFNAGVPKTIAYELLDAWVDDPPQAAHYEAHIGLLRSDFTYKPAATALKNLLALLSDPGANFTPTSLDFTITGGNSLLRHTLLQKRDGTFWLALWQDALMFDYLTNTDIDVASVAVTLGLPQNVVAARLYRPNVSDQAYATLSGLDQINVSVPGEVVLVQMDFTGATVPEPSTLLLVGAGVLTLGRRCRRR